MISAKDLVGSRPEIYLGKCSQRTIVFYSEPMLRALDWRQRLERIVKVSGAVLEPLDDPDITELSIC